jgi:hypothetical protein
MGDVRLLFPRDYIAAADLRGKDTVFTISAVIAKDELKTSKGKEIKPALRFKESDAMHKAGKQVPFKLVLNKTNMKAIAKAVGSFESKDWIGKRITLFPTECEAFGEVVECIRVRSKPPAASASSASLEERVAPPEPEEEDNEPEAERPPMREPGEDDAP